MKFSKEQMDNIKNLNTSKKDLDMAIERAKWVKNVKINKDDSDSYVLRSKNELRKAASNYNKAIKKIYNKK